MVMLIRKEYVLKEIDDSLSYEVDLKQHSWEVRNLCTDQLVCSGLFVERDKLLVPIGRDPCERLCEMVIAQGYKFVNKVRNDEMWFMFRASYINSRFGVWALTQNDFEAQMLYCGTFDERVTGKVVLDIGGTFALPRETICHFRKIGYNVDMLRNRMVDL